MRREEFVGDDRGYEERVIGCQHLVGRLLIEEVGVFDRTHPGLEAILDRLGSVGMGQDVGADAVGRLHRGGQLFDRILDVVQFIRGRGGSAAGHHLDLIGAPAQHLPGGAQDLRRTVSQDAL